MAERGDWQAISIASLPRRFRRGAEDFRLARHYLQADAERTAQWRARFETRPGNRTIGVAWRGGSSKTRGALRSIVPADFAVLGRFPAVRWVSLQYGDAEQDVRAMQAAGMSIARWAEIEGDLDACAAAICATDLVITIDSTVAHLAGALGKEVWILLHAGAEWRYGISGEEMPWYPSARLFRQAEGEGWAPVLERVASALATRSNTLPQS